MPRRFWTTGGAIAATVAAVASFLFFVTSESETLPATTAREESAERWNPDHDFPKPNYPSEIVPLFGEHCYACHGARSPRGDLNLQGLAANPQTDAEITTWERVSTALRAGTMPPPGRPRPAPEQIERIEHWLDAVAVESPRRPRVTVRRLNRTEYTHAIRDLTGLHLPVADDFPADDTGHGFDNAADVLSLSPLHAEKYVDAAERVVEAIFASEIARRKLANPAPDDPASLPYRKILLPERDPIRSRLVLSSEDLPPPDPAEPERQRAYGILAAFADRAFRRPATHDEINRLLRFAEESQRRGEGIEPGLRLALQAILASPRFLFRIEEPTAGRTTDLEFASRLSFFLWSTGPDEELISLALRGQLRLGNTLAVQTRRMLRDPKARALAENFNAQWLQLRGLKDFTPDAARFPEFDADLRTAMARETELFFEDVVREDRSLLDFLVAEHTFVNDRLARHYGMSDVVGGHFRKVSLAGTPRRGVLTHASVLAVTSNPTRTSPVKRGRWLLDTILGAAPPAPPPEIEPLKEPTAEAKTVRERMELHRTNPNCASCHASMDPLGLALEAFDAIGALRTRDGDWTIDDSATLADGRALQGPEGVRQLLVEQRGAFLRCFAEKMLTYALGRSPEWAERRTLADIVRKVSANELRFSALILAIVHSEPFQTRPGVSK